MSAFPVIILLLFAIQMTSPAQQMPFSQAIVTLPQLAYSACAWGDFDHDGDLDLALTGAEGNNPLTKIFRNDNGVFNDTQSNLLALHFGSAEWGDYDNDGDLDLLVTGIENQGNPHTIIYTNNNGSFSDSGIALPGIMDGEASWGDVNNDGYLDILLAGSSMARVYENDGNGYFIIISAPLPDMVSTMCSWSDYRNDGNDHFTRFDQNAANLLNPSFDLGDYNGDGLIDIILIGTTAGCGGPAVTMLLQNMGAMSFSIVSSLIPGYKLGGVTWGDYNNDGYTDLLFTGLDVFEIPQTDLYLNNLGDTTFFDLNTPPTQPGSSQVFLPEHIISASRPLTTVLCPAHFLNLPCFHIKRLEWANRIARISASTPIRARIKYLSELPDYETALSGTANRIIPYPF